MAYDPSLDLDEDVFEGIKSGGGGGPGTRPPGVSNPGPLFGFGLGSSYGPGFGPGSSAAWRRRLMSGGPVTAAAARNRYASPMGAQQAGAAGGSGLRGLLGSRFGQPTGDGAPTNPYGQPIGPDYLANLFGQYAQGSNGLDYALLGSLGQAGGFDPLGSPALIEALRQQALQSGRANEMSARTAALANAGNDPLMQAQAALGSRLGGASDTNRALLGARSASALQNQQFLQALSGGLLSGERGLGQNIHLQRMLQDIQGQPGFGDFLGGLLGIGTGGLLGNPGLFGGGGNRQVSGGMV